MAKLKSSNLRIEKYDYRETITPANTIPSKVFSGFKKACHDLYKFDSKTEKDFAIILEQEHSVLKWLRPAINQFNIYYHHNSQRYCPDFVVETANTIFLIETKKERDLENRDVQEKSLAALLYCTHATNFTQKQQGKVWKYVLLPQENLVIILSHSRRRNRISKATRMTLAKIILDVMSIRLSIFISFGY